MTDPDELASTLCAIRDAFAKLGVEWAIGGSLASSTYAEPRSTNDVGVIARLDEHGAQRLDEHGAQRLDEHGAQRLGELLGPHFYCSTEAALDAVRRRDSFNVIDERSFLKIDIFVPPGGPLGVGQLARRRFLPIAGGEEMPVLGPEDVVLQELRWFRIGGEVSDRQWRDILLVLRSGPLDDAYLDATAAHAALAALLVARARREASD